MKTIINIFLFFTLFVFSLNLYSFEVYKSIQDVIAKEVPLQDVDSDGIADYLDDCPDSFLGTGVNKHGCPQSSAIVLMPNNKSHNSIVVENEMGSVEVDKPYNIVNMNSDDEPSEPKKISKAELDKMFPFVNENKYKKATTYTIYFSALSLKYSSQLKLETIFKDIRGRKNPIIYISGHTDTKGPIDKNLLLSQKRANRIKKLIDDEGLKYLKINLEAKGEEDLEIQTKDEVSNFRNRRAIILIK